MQEFDFNLRTRVICGQGALDRVGELAGGFNASRALIVTDPGIIAAGHVERAIESLTAAGIAAHCFDGAHENPTTEDIDRGLEFAKRCEPELLIGLGGGSSMDCAKGINFVYTNGGTMHDYPRCREGKSTDVADDRSAYHGGEREVRCSPSP